MKIEIIKDNGFWYYNIDEWNYTQKEFDYAFKYLDFNKLGKKMYIYIFFNNEEIGEWFYKTHINSDWLDKIYKKSPLGYEYLKNNWGKGVFRIPVLYPDKQKFKTIINKVINIELIRGQNEN